MFLAVLLLCNGPSAEDCLAMVETRRLFADQQVCESYVAGAALQYSRPENRTVAKCLKLEATEV